MISIDGRDQKNAVVDTWTAAQAPPTVSSPEACPMPAAQADNAVHQRQATENPSHERKCVMTSNAFCAT